MKGTDGQNPKVRNVFINKDFGVGGDCFLKFVKQSKVL